ncbi:hypothetical protein BC628DRAFT_858843 [Trametes gibbosa]|nr:hypothetical protein BC628DRAFT_858843 [Trametes gibbosa]
MDRTSSSDSSSDSPPNMGLEDDMLMEGPSEPYTGRDMFATMANMKRQHTGRPVVFGSGEGVRETKPRRKDHRGGSALWEATAVAGAGRQRDELVDGALVEQLRNQFGDPFDDSILKKAAGASS